MFVTSSNNSETIASSNRDSLSGAIGVIKDVHGNLITSSSLIPIDEVYNDQTFQFDPLSEVAIESIEGCVLKLFFQHEEIPRKNFSYLPFGWQIATHKRISAFDSKWGCSRSFGMFFKNAVDNVYNGNPELFYDSLDKDLVYIFVIKSVAENSVLKRGSTPYTQVVDDELIVAVGTVPKNEENYIPTLWKKTPPIGTAAKSFSDYAEIAEFFENYNIRTSQGLLIFGEFETRRVSTSEYFWARNLRDPTESSVLRRYVKLLHEHPDDVLAYTRLFDEYADSFAAVHTAIRDLAHYIVNSYTNRYLLNNFVVVPKPAFLIMKKIHNKAPVDITIDYVLNVMQQTDASLVLQAINEVFGLKL